MKLKKGDTVQIIKGKDNGREGKITKVFPKENKVIVEGLNIFKKHIKKQSADQPGGIIEVERAIPASNVQLVCPACGKITRVGYQITDRGDKIRICKKCDAPVTPKKETAK